MSFECSLLSYLIPRVCIGFGLVDLCTGNLPVFNEPEIRNRFKSDEPMIGISRFLINLYSKLKNELYGILRFGMTPEDN